MPLTKKSKRIPTVQFSGAKITDLEIQTSKTLSKKNW